jgi:hypothetical protein
MRGAWLAIALMGCAPVIRLQGQPAAFRPSAVAVGTLVSSDSKWQRAKLGVAVGAGCLQAIIDAGIQPIMLWSAKHAGEGIIRGDVEIARRSDDIRRLELALINATDSTVQATVSIESFDSGDPAQAGRSACSMLLAASRK